MLPHARFPARLARVRVVVPLLLMALVTLACNLGAQPPEATSTAVSGGGGAATIVANSDVPEVEIRSPADGSQAVVQSEVQVYVRAVDKTGVTRIEMRANNIIVDAVASVDPRGTTQMDSILSWTPTLSGPAVVQVVAFRNNVKGNPKTITLQVVTTAAQVTKPVGSPNLLTASPTNDPVCRVRVNVDGLNVRNGPSITYDIVGTLKLGTLIAVTGTVSDRSWWQISAPGLFGWVSASYTTTQGFCGNVLNVPIPSSPTPIPGATQIVILPTFTPLPPIIQPTPTTTIPVIVLPTLTATVPLPPQSRPPSIGDLSSTAIFATQTALALPPVQLSPTITPGGPSATPTSTPTRPNLQVINVYPQPPSVNLTNGQASLAYTVRVKNIGSAPAPVFEVAVITATDTFRTLTIAVLNPGEQADVTVNVSFVTAGLQGVTLVADSSNVVQNEETKNDNIVPAQINVIAPTNTPGPTSTSTLTFTPPPTETLIPTVTPAPTETLAPTYTPTESETPTLTPAFTETETPTLFVPPQETATETPTALVLPTETETPTNTPELSIPTIACPPVQPATLLIEPLPATTTDPTVQLTINTSNGAPYDSLSVTSGAGTFTFQPGQVVIVPLALNGPNILVVIAQMSAQNVNGCDYPAYPVSVNVDKNGTPLQITQQPPPTPTETPTGTVEPTVCPPAQPATLLVEPIAASTTDLTVQLTVNSSTGAPYDNLTVSSNAGQFTFQAGEPIVVQLAPNTVNNLTITANFPATTDANGCAYAAYQATIATDKNGAPLQIIQQPPPTPTETPTGTAQPTVCPPAQPATLLVEPIAASTTDLTVQLTVNSSTGAPYDNLTVSSEAGQVTFQFGQPIIVTLVPKALNNLTITANFPATNVNGCDYPAYQATIATDKNGAPLQITQQVPVPPTETPTDTPQPTVCPPAQPATLIVEPIVAATTDQTIQLIVSTSTGAPYDNVVVSSNAGQFPFQFGQPIIVPLVPNSPNQFTITANFPATNVNGCDYPAYQATIATDKNGAPLQTTQQVPATPTSIPTDTPQPTVCPPAQPAALVVEPIVAVTTDQTIQLIVNTSTGAPYDNVVVSSNAGQFPFQFGQPIVVPLVPNSPNQFTITANFAATNVNGCDYPAYQATAATDKNGTPLQTTQQAPATPTEVPTNTPEPTVCPPAQPAALVVEPVPPTTTDASVQLTVNTSTGAPYDNVLVSSEAGQFPFQFGQPIVVPLVPNAANNLTITANFAATNVNGCDYPAYQATAATDKNGTPLQIAQQAPVPPTDAPPQNDVIDLAGVPQITNLDDQAVRTKVTDIFNRGKQNGFVKEDFSVIGDKTLAFAQAIAGQAANFETVPELQPVAQYFGAGFPSIAERIDKCNADSRQYFDCATFLGAGIAFIDLGNAYRGQPPEQLRADLDNLLNQLEQGGIIPVLVTIAGPTNDGSVAQYNTVIARLAQQHQLPLLNLYKIGADNPSLLNGDKLTTPPGDVGAANFSQAGLPFGENTANIAILRMLNEIKTKVIDANP